MDANRQVRLHEFEGPPQGPLVVVHGGAWAIPDECVADHETALARALMTARRSIAMGKSAAEVVVDAIASMENSAVFDAGAGSVLNKDGQVEMDAGIMTGNDSRWGAVGAVKHLPNPIIAANTLRADVKMEARFLVSEGAERYAAERGLPAVSNESLICKREEARYQELLERYKHMSASFSSGPRGTVGCVVRDADGNLAAGTSTGGTPFRPAGRVGDSPIPGSGYYSDSGVATSATGWGEAIATVQLCRTASNHVLDSGQAGDSIARALSNMYDTVKAPDQTGGRGGLIMLTREGRIAIGYSTERMARGWIEGTDIIVQVN